MSTRVTSTRILFVLAFAAPALMAWLVSAAPSSEVPLPKEAVEAAHKKGKESRCEACHTEAAWVPARFSHERTGFPLKGRHQSAPCFGCHQSDYAKQLPITCAGCHRDPHGQEFGMMCQGCHTETGWQTSFTVDAHRRAAFPLIGRHAAIPCEECHRNRRDRSFVGTAVGCVDCHQSDYDRAFLTSVDHRRSGFSTSCRSCHAPTSFSPGAFLSHESCFPILQGPHRGVRCAECHQPTAQLVARGTCATGTPRCTSCHEHRCDEMDEEHREVSGYQCADAKCIGCHTR